MENLKYWLAFSKMQSVGSVFIRKSWEYFGSIKDAWFASNVDFLQIENMKYNTVENFIEERKSINPDEILKDFLKLDVKAIPLESPDYPNLLKQIYDPPAVLFVKGDLARCNFDKTLAIVGPRKASDYIINVLKKMILDLRNSDITIVSGMALGVDACSHRAAIENNLASIAVLGSGVEHIYPRNNKDIYEKLIQNHGAVISEYYPTKEPEPWCFPVRNRIISGLSKGTIIAEAGLKSGALITAKAALDQSREIMCIPGLITNPNTEGTHKLIKEGAGVVTCADDIFRILGWENFQESVKKNDKFKIKLLDKELQVYEILKLEPKSFDCIFNELKIDVNELLVLLTNMELNGIIKQLPGQNYMLVKG